MPAVYQNGVFALQESDLKRTFGERVRDRRKEIRMSGPTLAQALDIDVSSLYSLETGKTKLPSTPEMIDRYAEILKVSSAYLMGYTAEKNPDLTSPPIAVQGVPIVGAIEAGVFRLKEATAINDVFVPASPDPRYARSEQFALKVIGNSANLKVPDGGYVIVTPYDQARHQPADKDLVVISAWRATAREVTVRQLLYTGGGYELKMMTSDPQLQDSLVVDPHLKVISDNDIHIDIDYLVIGFFTPA